MHSRNGGIIAWLTTRRQGTTTPSLGARELAVLECLWRDGSLSALQVQRRMEHTGVRLSTVQSTLERLHRKQLVRRQKHARAYRYSAEIERRELVHSLLRDITREIAGGNVAPVVSGFMEYLAEADPALQTALSELLDAEQRPREDD